MTVAVVNSKAWITAPLGSEFDLEPAEVVGGHKTPRKRCPPKRPIKNNSLFRSFFATMPLGASLCAILPAAFAGAVSVPPKREV